jgi:beta propeller repeat protein
MSCLSVLCWAADPGEINVCVLSSAQSDPAADGTRVVWTDDRSGNNDIWGYDTAAGAAFPVCLDNADQDGPAISGNIVVWRDFRNGNPDIYGYDLSTKTEFVVCQNSADQWHPDVYGDIVVWMDYRNGNNWDIYGYEISSHTEFVICSNNAAQWNPTVGSGKVVWEDYRNGNPDIFMFNLVYSTESSLCTLTSQQKYPEISGNTIVWMDNRNGNWDVYGYWLGIGAGERTYVLEAGDQLYPEIAGDMIVWQDTRNGNNDIYAGDLSVPVIFPVCLDSSNQLYPVVGDGVIAWQDNRSGNNDILGFALDQREMLIKADASEPDVSGDKVVYLRNGGIYGWDFALNSEFTVTTGQFSGQYNPAIGGHIVAWEDGSPPWNFKLYAYNLDTQTEFIATSANYTNTKPDVSNDGAKIVWENNSYTMFDDWDIWMYDTAGMYVSKFVQVSGSWQTAPAISDNWIVWEDTRDGGKRIYVKNRSGGAESAVSPSGAELPAVSGNIVVWVDYRNGNPDIYGYDLSSLTEFPICTNIGEQTNPAICGQYVVWQDWRNDTGGYTNSDIYGYDLATNTEFTICTASGNQQRPEIDGKLVVWHDERRGSTTPDVYGRYLDHVWNDDCESAVDVEQSRVYEGSTEFATGVDVSSCTTNDSADIWFRFVPDITGEYTVSLMGSGFDTSLAVYAGCGGTELGCNDDYALTSQSQIDYLMLGAGQDYRIRIAGWQGARGDYRLRITGPTCVHAMVGDSNKDCVINLADLQSLATQWLQNNIHP